MQKPCPICARSLDLSAKFFTLRRFLLRQQVTYPKEESATGLKIPPKSAKGGDSTTKKLITNVVKYPITFLVTFSDGRQEEITVEAESVTAAALLMPPDAVTWEPLEWKD